MSNAHQNPHLGSSFESFLVENHIHEEANNTAIKRVIAWQLEQAMTQDHISKAAMAKKMNTSRSQLDRLLDPENESVTLATLSKAAEVIGRKLRLEFV